MPLPGVAGGVVRCLLGQEVRLLQGQVNPGEPVGPLLEPRGRSQATQGRHGEHHSGESQLEATRPTLGPGPGLGNLGGADGLLSPGRGGGASEFGRVQPLLD